MTTPHILATCIASCLLACTIEAFVLPHPSPWRRAPSIGRIFLSSSAAASSSSSSSSSSEDSSLFDMKELQQRINQEYSAAACLPIGVGVGTSPSRTAQEQRSHSHSLQEQEEPPQRPPKPDKVHVVIFQPGTMNQGAHTIEYPQGSGNNVVLAFQSYHACLHFAESLAEQNFVDPEPLEFDMDKLESYFDRLGVAVQVIPQGVELKPPTKNVPRFGHDPTLRDTKKHLEYLFDMMTTTDDDDWEDLGLLLDTTTTTTSSSYDASNSWQ